MSLFTNQESILQLDTDLDISTASVRRILYRKPSGTRGYWSASLYGTDSLRYQLTDSDLDEEGRWYFQAFVTIAGNDYYGDEVRKEVLQNLA